MSRVSQSPGSERAPVQRSVCASASAAASVSADVDALPYISHTITTRWDGRALASELAAPGCYRPPCQLDVGSRDAYMAVVLWDVVALHTQGFIFKQSLCLCMYQCGDDDDDDDDDGWGWGCGYGHGRCVRACACASASRGRSSVCRRRAPDIAPTWRRASETKQDDDNGTDTSAVSPAADTGTATATVRTFSVRSLSISLSLYLPLWLSLSCFRISYLMCCHGTSCPVFVLFGFCFFHGCRGPRCRVLPPPGEALPAPRPSLGAPWHCWWCQRATADE